MWICELLEKWHRIGLVMLWQQIRFGMEYWHQKQIKFNVKPLGNHSSAPSLLIHSPLKELDSYTIFRLTILFFAVVSWLNTGGGHVNVLVIKPILSSLMPPVTCHVLCHFEYMEIQKFGRPFSLNYGIFISFCQRGLHAFWMEGSNAVPNWFCISHWRLARFYIIWNSLTTWTTTLVDQKV